MLPARTLRHAAACSSTGTFDLQQLPELSEEFKAQAAAIKGKFKGDPTNLYGEGESWPGAGQAARAPASPSRHPHRVNRGRRGGGRRF